MYCSEPDETFNTKNLFVVFIYMYDIYVVFIYMYLYTYITRCPSVHVCMRMCARVYAYVCTCVCVFARVYAYVRVRHGTPNTEIL